MPPRVHANVPLAFLEYRLAYRDRVLDSLALYKEVPSAVLPAFREWNVVLENVTSKQNPANLGEVSVSFALIGAKIIFTVGLGNIHILVTNPNWGDSETIIKVAKAGIAAVHVATGTETGSQRASLAIHLQPTTGVLKDFVAGFLRADLEEFVQPGIKAFGVSVYREDSSWVADASAAFPGGLFLKVERIFGSGVPLEKIAVQLKEDEDRLLGLLNLEVG